MAEEEGIRPAAYALGKASGKPNPARKCFAHGKNCTGMQSRLPPAQDAACPARHAVCQQCLWKQLQLMEKYYFCAGKTEFLRATALSMALPPNGVFARQTHKSLPCINAGIHTLPSDEKEAPIAEAFLPADYRASQGYADIFPTSGPGSKICQRNWHPLASKDRSCVEKPRFLRQVILA